VVCLPVKISPEARIAFEMFYKNNSYVEVREQDAKKAKQGRYEEIPRIHTPSQPVPAPFSPETGGVGPFKTAAGEVSARTSWIRSEAEEEYKKAEAKGTFPFFSPLSNLEFYMTNEFEEPEHAESKRMIKDNVVDILVMQKWIAEEMEEPAHKKTVRFNK